MALIQNGAKPGGQSSVITCSVKLNYLFLRTLNSDRIARYTKTKVESQREKYCLQYILHYFDQGPNGNILPTVVH